MRRSASCDADRAAPPFGGALCSGLPAPFLRFFVQALRCLAVWVGAEFDVEGDESRRRDKQGTIVGVSQLVGGDQPAKRLDRGGGAFTVLVGGVPVVHR